MRAKSDFILFETWIGSLAQIYSPELSQNIMKGMSKFSYSMKLQLSYDQNEK